MQTGKGAEGKSITQTRCLRGVAHITVQNKNISVQTQLGTEGKDYTNPVFVKQITRGRKNKRVNGQNRQIHKTVCTRYGVELQAMKGVEEKLELEKQRPG